MKIEIENKSEPIIIDKVQNLMEILNSNNVFVPFICAGKGTCGKCKIQIIEGELAITEFDKKFLTQLELNQGYRLCCKAYPKNDLKLRVLQNQNIQAISEYNLNTTEINNEYSVTDYGIAIDIGTTTIALELINLFNGKTESIYTLLNSQIAFGADIISRIQKSKKYTTELKNCIQNDILKGLDKFNTFNLKKIVISANTTMIHLLMGYDCSGLGIFPFKPFSLNQIKCKFNDVFKSDLDTDLIIMPSISAYIGADIVSGLLFCNFDKEQDISMLIDIGTNGEMAIGNKDKILCTSAPAGPALEGGNIECGTGSIAGAIYKIQISQSKIYYNTIENQPPIGICGSAVIDITAEALRNNLIDETGLLKDELFETGIKIYNNIKFSQQDFRQIQLAKSSIRAGIDILIKNYGCNYDDIKTVYLAGGFGYHIDINNAIFIGLIPNEFKSKIKVIGNSSLGGAKNYMLDKLSNNRIENILNISDELYLSNDTEFTDKYMNNMYFRRNE